MRKQKATELFDLYMQRDDARDLSFRQIDAVIDTLVLIPHIEGNTDDVARIVEQKFPKENQMHRPYSPTQKPQQKQSIKEVAQIIEYFIANYWARLVPKAIVPTENGNKKNAINYLNFGTAVRERFNEGKRIGHDVLGEIALSLDAAGLLEHHPQVVERIVEVEKPVPLTRREEQKHNFNLEKLMNAPGVEAIKGIGEQVQKKPIVPQAQLEAQARHDLNENAVMGEINAKINQHRHHGMSHSATANEKKILETLRDTGIRAGTPNEKINAQIDAKRSEMSTWTPQRALRELHGDLVQRAEAERKQKPQGQSDPESFIGQPKATRY